LQQWSERMAQQSMAAFQPDESKMGRIQELTDEWVKTQSMAVLEEMQELQEELYAPAQAAGAILEQGVEQRYPPNTTEAMEQTRYFIAEEKSGHIARLIMVFPLSSLGHTVIQDSWNLVDYPSAWPAADAEPE
ncbi:MAG: hypothetical protein ACREO9_05455, partial [Lysobacterales bacterium]